MNNNNLSGFSQCDITHRRTCILATLLCLSVLLNLIFYVIGFHKHYHALHEGDNNGKLRRNIFFVETSGALDLEHRQACSVESAAIHNGDHFTINLVMSVTRNSPAPNSFVDILAKYYNVSLVALNFTEMFRGTVAERLISREEMEESDFKVLHKSDLLRLMLVWSYGGIYLDLDCFVLRAFDGQINFTVMEHEEALANGIFGFDKRHPLLERCLKDFAKNYDPNEFAGNGPRLLTRNLRDFCHEQNLSKINETSCGIAVLSRKFAFEIHYNELGTLFNSPYKKSSLRRIRTSHVVHLWNYLSHKIKNTEVGGNSLVEKLMRENCPIIYSEIVNRQIKYV